MNIVTWQPNAFRKIKKLGDKSAQARILTATAGLAAVPDVANAKTLTNHQHGYRLRVGDYRVIFDALEAVSIIRIEEVKKRDERTY